MFIALGKKENSMVEDSVVLTDATGTEKVEPKEPKIAMKPVNFSLNEVLFVKGVRFKITYFNNGKKRMTLEHYPFTQKEIEELEKTKKEEK